MTDFGGNRNAGHPARCGIWMLLCAAAALAAPVPAAAQDKEPTPAERCAKAMASYGATFESEASTQRKIGHKSVYADGKLANGETVRMRCSIDGDSVARIEIFAPPTRGNPNPGAKWTAAEELLGPPKKAEDQEKPVEKAETTPPGTTPPPEGEQPAPPEDQRGKFKRVPTP